MLVWMLDNTSSAHAIGYRADNAVAWKRGVVVVYRYRMGQNWAIRYCFSGENSEFSVQSDQAQARLGDDPAGGGDVLGCRWGERVADRHYPLAVGCLRSVVAGSEGTEKSVANS